MAPKKKQEPQKQEAKKDTKSPARGRQGAAAESSPIFIPQPKVAAKKSVSKSRTPVKDEQVPEIKKTGSSRSNSRSGAAKKETSPAIKKERSSSQSESKAKEEFKEPGPIVRKQSASRSNERQQVVVPQASSFMEMNKLIGSLLKPQHSINPITSSKFYAYTSDQGQQLTSTSQQITPKLDKAIIGQHIEKVSIQSAEELFLKKLPSNQDGHQQHVGQMGSGGENANLLAQAMKTGQLKHINRNEAMTRAGIATVASANGSAQEKKNLLSMATIGGVAGMKQLGGGVMMGPPVTKEELMKEKQSKDKQTLQENSLVAFAMSEQPDLYAPNTLPFFNQKAKDYEQTEVKNQGMGLQRESSVASAKLQKEQSSTLKLKRTEEQQQEENEVQNLLLGKEARNGEPSEPRISEMEPFIIQLPSTLPMQLHKEQQLDLNNLMNELSLHQKEKAHLGPLPFGKILIKKSGKVILRVPSDSGKGDHTDFELIKGIQTNFYQELISAHPSKQNIHFLGPINHKLIAVPDLDQIFN